MEILFMMSTCLFKINFGRLSSEGKGSFKAEGVSLPERGVVPHGQEVDLACDEGYFRNGPERLRCWYGEWSAGMATSGIAILV